MISVSNNQYVFHSIFPPVVNKVFAVCSPYFVLVTDNLYFLLFQELYGNMCFTTIVNIFVQLNI